MGRFKMAPSMSPAEIDRLDDARRAMKTMYLPTKADLIALLANELDNANFTEIEVNLYFKLFNNDLHAVKGRSTDKNIRHSSSLRLCKKGESAPSGDVMTLAGATFMAIVLVSPGEARRLLICVIYSITLTLFLSVRVSIRVLLIL